MTITEAAVATKVDIKEFRKAFKIPVSVPDTTIMKEISTVDPGYNFEAIKTALE